MALTRDTASPDEAKYYFPDLRNDLFCGHSLGTRFLTAFYRIIFPSIGMKNVALCAKISVPKQVTNCSVGLGTKTTSLKKPQLLATLKALPV